MIHQYPSNTPTSATPATRFFFTSSFFQFLVYPQPKKTPSLPPKKKKKKEGAPPTATTETTIGSGDLNPVAKKTTSSIHRGFPIRNVHSVHLLHTYFLPARRLVDRTNPELGDWELRGVGGWGGMGRDGDLPRPQP